MRFNEFFHHVLMLHVRLVLYIPFAMLNAHVYSPAHTHTRVVNASLGVSKKEKNRKETKNKQARSGPILNDLSQHKYHRFMPSEDK